MKKDKINKKARIVCSTAGDYEGMTVHQVIEEWFDRIWVDLDDLYVKTDDGQWLELSIAPDVTLVDDQEEIKDLEETQDE